MALWEKPEVAATQAHCSVDERHGQSALVDLPRENDGLEGTLPTPIQQITSPQEVFLLG